MEDDVDIYADLPSYNPERNDQDCNCKELKKELNSLVSKLESIQRIKMNLEKNLSSLLKTAKAEIARKDKMIDDLRKRLDDVTFRRSNKSESLGSTHRLPHQHTITRKYENVSPIHSQESETESHQIQFHHEHKNRKPQNDINRIPTVFGERLHKRIIEDEKDEKKQKTLLKYNVEVKTKDISKENVENDKENGSQFSINNGNESNTGQYSSSEPPYRKNLVKRTNEEDDIRRRKRLKIENNEDKTTTEETDYLTRYDLIDNPMQYEMKDGLTKFEDGLDAVHSFKEEIPSRRRAASEHQNTKQDQNCTNGWRSEAKSNSAKDYDNSNVRNSSADSLRNSRTASMSNYVSEGFNSGYKKNGHRYSPPKRSYSKSRSDYESSSSHRLRERSNRTYREKKYDDYKYDSRYKNGRLKRNYENEKNDGKTRYRRRERSNLRDKSKYSSSDAEDKESTNSYKNKKYENRRIKKERTNVLNDKKLYESNKVAAETDFREFSSQTIVNNSMNTGKSITEESAGKNIEQHEMKNESEIKSSNATESISVHVAIEDLPDLDNLEEGEILDTPEKKNNSAKISKDNKMEENNIKIVLVEDKKEDISVNASIDDKSISCQNDVNSTKQLEMADISTKKIEVVSCLLQENSKDCGEIIQLNSSKNDMAIDEVYNCIKDEDTCKKDDDTYKSHINEDLMDSTTHIIMSEQVRDNDIDGNDKNNSDKISKDSITETVIKIKEITNSNIESVTEIKELNLSIKSTTKKEETDNSNIESVVEITEMNNFNSDNSIHKNDGDELRTSTVEVVTRVEAVLNCDIEDEDKSHVPIESETFQMSNKNNVEVCLNDHNYVQNSSINISDLDATQKPSLRSECDEAVLEIATSKEMKTEQIVNVQSVDVKRTVPCILKNKKDQKSKGILISHRRKAVILSDSNASMTILMNTNIAKTSCVINNSNDNDSTLKPRACKISRVSAKATCK